MPSTSLIELLFVAIFCVATLQYYWLDPKRRILNPPFGLMASSLLVIIFYPVYAQLSPGKRDLAWTLLVLGIVWLGLAYWVQGFVRRQKAH